MSNKIQKTVVNVIATSYVRSTKQKLTTRMEQIDLTKDLWSKWPDWTEQQVAELYESFWNDLNPNSHEIVLVDSVC